MKVLVIGARGYIGQHLCMALSLKGHKVLSYSSSTEGGISPVDGLFAQDLAFPPGIDAVYFLAQSPRYREVPQRAAHMLAVNCVSAVQAAEAARKSGASRFIYASTGNVYAPSFEPFAETSPVRRDNWYSLSKVMAEDALALYRRDLDVTACRIFGVYGPHQQGKLVPMLLGSIRDGREITADINPRDPSDVDGLRISLLYIDDLIDSMIHLLTIDDCHVVNLASPEAVSIRRLAAELGRCLGREPRVRTSDRQRETDLVADVTLYEKLFGSPKVTLAEGVQRVVEGEQQR